MAVLMLPFTLGVPLGSYVSGKSMQTAARERQLLAIGSACAGFGCLVLALGRYEASLLLLVSLFVIGSGVGLCIPASIVAVQAAVRPPMIGIATATSGMFRTLGGSLGIALMSTALFAHLIIKDTATEATNGRRLDLLMQVSPDQLVRGFDWAFIICDIAGLCALILSLTLPRIHASPIPATTINPGDKP